MFPLRRGKLGGCVAVWQEVRSDSASNPGTDLLVQVSLHGEIDTFHLPLEGIKQVEMEALPVGSHEVLACESAVEAAESKRVAAIADLAVVQAKLNREKAKLTGLRNKIQKLKGMKMLKLWSSFRDSVEEIL